jgi:rRNA maturation endonuclease Nob1
MKKGEAKPKIRCLGCGAIIEVPSPYCLLCGTCTSNNRRGWEADRASVDVRTTCLMGKKSEVKKP